MRSWLKVLVCLIAATVLVHLNYSTSAQILVPEVKIDTNAIDLGGQTDITLRVETGKEFIFHWPTLADTLTSHIEIIKQTGIDTLRIKKQDKYILYQRITITSFDTGYHVIPPLVFQYRRSADTTWTNAESSPILLFVNAPTVDTEQPFKDIKDPMPAPYTIREMLKWIFLLLFAGLLALGIWYFMQRRKQHQPLLVLPKKPAIPPHRLAFDELEALRSKRLWQNGRVKEYHSELTDIIRKYIKGRFNIKALEMTTHEILDDATQANISTNTQGKLENILLRADLVKFAKSQPLPDEHEKSFAETIDFVKDTIPVVVETSTSEESIVKVGQEKGRADS
ncbi:MAG: hypothetical protein U1C46_02620 [Bacteroidales bacterium]|nr:hypothetical protein [Bacteroidales bacterium]